MQVFASRKNGLYPQIVGHHQCRPVEIPSLCYSLQGSVCFGAFITPKNKPYSVIALRDRDLGRWDLRQVEKHLCSWMAPGCVYCTQKPSDNLCFQFTSASAALRFFWSHCLPESTAVSAEAWKRAEEFWHILKVHQKSNIQVAAKLTCWTY